MGDVHDRIDKSLRNKGYDRSTLMAPGGFAIVTAMERIHEKDLTPFETPYRWTDGEIPLNIGNFRLEDYINRLLFGEPGHYRMFLFIVSNSPIQYDQSPIYLSEGRVWVGKGDAGLPELIRPQPLANTHCDLLVYHFKNFGGDPHVLIPSGAAEKHLEAAGLYPAILYGMGR